MLVRFAVTLVLGMSFAVSSPAGEPLRIRVLTYNVHHGEGVDGKLDLERTARVIAESEADLVALQEVDQNVARTGSVDQPAEWMRLTKLQGAFGGNLKLQGGDYGNLVLSRWPIVRQTNHKLPNLAGGEPRGALKAQIELPGSRGILTLICTHFDHRPDDAERRASAKQLTELKTEPLALLAGDLNATSESPTLKLLSEAWQPTNSEPLPTIPVDKPKQQIDFVLVRPHARWKVVETRVLDEATASDHRPLLSVLELGE